MLENYVLRPVLSFLLKLLFRVELHGLEHYRAAGDRVLIVANHQSFLDPLLLAVFIPEKPAFAINVFQAQKWYFAWIPKIIKLYRVDPLQPLSMKHLIRDLRVGAKLVIFPEGRITTSGGLMKMYDGTGMIIEKTGATVLPVRIDGAEYSKLSRIGRKVRCRWFPKIRVTFLPPVTFPKDEPLHPNAISDLMAHAAFAATDYRRPVLSAILEASLLHGGGHVIAEDINRTPMGYRQLFTRAFVLSEKLVTSCGLQSSSTGSPSGIDPVQPLHGSQDIFVGVMLPSSAAAVVTFVGLHLLKKIPCMLNFSAGEANIIHACKIATVKTVLTSRAFIEKGKLHKLIQGIEKECRVVYLEDIRPSITINDKLRGLVKGFLAHKIIPSIVWRVDPDSPAVILYTSGSEGTPKGVALSHTNILSNIAQASARLDLTTADRLFNAMPVFHSFGLTVGMILPLVRGIKAFHYPTPLHYRIIPDLIYDTDTTVMLGTDTFYNGYAHYAHPYDFWSVRLAVSGAEKLKETTRRMYMDKFRLDIVEGYGVTEASPVVSVNTPKEHKAGSVGRFFPGIDYALTPVEGLASGGRLMVKGSNIMLGYLKSDQPGIIQSQGEWYDTGDIVSIDNEGYIFIQGRAKRFAKIAGEMVSLLVVEDMAGNLYPDAGHAAMAAPDERKGEHIILYTESKELTREQLVVYARGKGLPEIALPKQIIMLDAIPRLGNGKIDYVGLGAMASSSP